VSHSRCALCQRTDGAHLERSERVGSLGQRVRLLTNPLEAAKRRGCDVRKWLVKGNPLARKSYGEFRWGPIPP
jgi:hypothetical protein